MSLRSFPTQLIRQHRWVITRCSKPLNILLSDFQEREMLQRATHILQSAHRNFFLFNICAVNTHPLDKISFLDQE